MLDLNDEVNSKLTHQEFEGEVVLGVPHDVIYPEISQIIQRFAAEYPRMKVQFISSFTRELRAMFARGEADVILTTEDRPDAGGETLAISDLVWIGAPGGSCWKQRPLRLAFENHCLFCGPVLAALDAAGIEWKMVIDSDNTSTIEATVSADLAVHALLEGAEPPYVERIVHGGALPELPETNINMYRTATGNSQPIADLAAILRQAYLRS